MNQDLEYKLFLTEVAKQAQQLGYTVQQILMFQGDIKEAFMEGKDVETTVEEIF